MIGTEGSPPSKKARLIATWLIVLPSAAIALLLAYPALVPSGLIMALGTEDMRQERLELLIRSDREEADRWCRHAMLHDRSQLIRMFAIENASTAQSSEAIPKCLMDDSRGVRLTVYEKMSFDKTLVDAVSKFALGQPGLSLETKCEVAGAIGEAAAPTPLAYKLMRTYKGSGDTRLEDYAVVALEALDHFTKNPE